ncbi:hypothetical protein DJ68_14770 [Halorubrum sp. C3]|nr:hypothetical protein DJ68_14770 [Halorubrum sp. C3]
MTLEVDADPYEFEFDPEKTALMVVDMQRDFIEEGGFGEYLGNDVSRLRKAVEPTQKVLEAARDAGLKIIHTREGHREEMTDAPPSKVERGDLDVKIGDEGPMGKVLVRGERGHDFVEELQPEEGETIIDKPGKGSFYSTDLDLVLRNDDIENIIVTGVTTEVCVQSTVREANDRGYECLVLEDCTASYFPEFDEVGIKMIKAQGAIFGWVADSDGFITTLSNV